jgi:membrane-associated phospholipid phosphatase
MLNKFFALNQETKSIMNSNVIFNYSKLRFSLFFLPLALLVSVVLFLYIKDSLSTDGYIQIQKNIFYFLNSKISQFPHIVYNLTQIGDALIFLSFLTLFILYAPKIWESLIAASIVSALFSNVLKILFSIPRPAAAFDNESFTIIGRALPGHNSLPSGHSITIFTVLTVLLFANLPKKAVNKFLWYFFIVSVGLILVFTRVGVGAHYPIDVIVGSCIGYISGLIGIFICRKYKICAWVNNIRNYPIFIVLFLVCCVVLISKIINENLFIYYISLFSLIISLFKISYVYIKK